MAKELLDEFHQHEALHTAHVLSDTWAKHVMDSRFVSEYPEIRKLAEDAASAMSSVYQAIGAVELD